MESEFEDIYEVEIAGGSSYWIDKDTYEAILSNMEDGFSFAGQVDCITFKPLGGGTITTWLNDIIILTLSTKESRAKSKALNKKWKEQNTPKEWEEND
jgi:hypothetical protein